MQLGTKSKIHLSDSLENFISNAMSVHGYLFNCKVKEFRLNNRDFNSINSSYAQYLVLKDENYNIIHDLNNKPIKLDWTLNIPSHIFRNAVTDYRNAVDRYRKGLGKQPKFKKRNQKNTIYITNELFYITHPKTYSVIDPATNIETILYESYRVHLKTNARQKKSEYEVFTVNHGKNGIEQLPNAFRIKIYRNEYYFTASYDDLIEPISQADLVRELSYKSYAELEQIVMGIDRGIAHIVSMDGQFFDVDPDVLLRLIRNERGRRKHQKRFNRQTHTNRNGGKAFPKDVKKPPLKKGEKIDFSKNMEKVKDKISKSFEYQTNCRVDQSHKISKQVVEHAKENGIRVIAFEELKLQNMMKRPKKAKKVNGRFVRNGARAKSGLNKALAGANLGATKRCISYKAARENILIMTVPPHYTSQRCAECGHTSKQNRKSQSLFVCEICGHTANADHNADANIKHIACQKLSEGSFTLKDKKTVAVRKKNNGGTSGCSPMEDIPENACGEAVRRISNSTNTPASAKQESCIILENI